MWFIIKINLNYRFFDDISIFFLSEPDISPNSRDVENTSSYSYSNSLTSSNSQEPFCLSPTEPSEMNFSSDLSKESFQFKRDSKSSKSGVKKKSPVPHLF